MLIKELIERVTSIYHQGARNYYTRLSNKRVYSIASTIRTLLLMQMANKKQSISPYNYETLPCIKLKTVDRVTCPCTTPLNCTVLKSEEKIPKIVNSLYGLLIQGVTLVDGTLINQAGVNQAKYVLYNKYTGNKPNWFIFDDYLYLINLQNVEFVTLTAIFEDILDKRLLFKCNPEDEICTYSALEENFTIDNNLITVIVKMIVEEISILQQEKKPQEKEQQQEQDESDN